MTKTEAIQFDVSISQSMSDKLKVQIDENYITFTEDGEQYSIKYSGTYEWMMCIISHITKVIHDNTISFKNLMQAYNNIASLTTDVINTDVHDE